MFSLTDRRHPQRMRNVETTKTKTSTAARFPWRCGGRRLCRGRRLCGGRRNQLADDDLWMYWVNEKQNKQTKNTQSTSFVNVKDKVNNGCFVSSCSSSWMFVCEVTHKKKKAARSHIHILQGHLKIPLSKNRSRHMQTTKKTSQSIQQNCYKWKILYNQYDDMTVDDDRWARRVS